MRVHAFVSQSAKPYHELHPVWVSRQLSACTACKSAHAAPAQQGPCLAGSASQPLQRLVGPLQVIQGQVVSSFARTKANLGHPSRSANQSAGTWTHACKADLPQINDWSPCA